MAKQQKRKVSSEMGSSTMPTAARSTGSTEFNPDYTPVIKNLRKIAVMAVIFIAFLVILSFIL